MFKIAYFSEAQQKMKQPRWNFVLISENQTDFVGHAGVISSW